jgi:Transposase DDE domain group 1
VLRDQPGVFGPVASTATAWRVLASVNDAVLDEVKTARAVARQRARLLRREAGRGGSTPGVRRHVGAGPGDRPGRHASDCHSEKQGAAAATFKHGFGYHPLLAWLDNTGEALVGMLRPGNANANTAADHIQVTDEALVQLPDEDRHGTPILVRADGAGAIKAWLAHFRILREQHGLAIEFSVGFTTNQLKDAIGVLPETAWTVAVDAAGQPRPVDESGLPTAGRRADRAPARSHRGGLAEVDESHGPAGTAVTGEQMRGSVRGGDASIGVAAARAVRRR